MQAVANDFYAVVEETARDLYIRALKSLPPDVVEAIKGWMAVEESPTGRAVLTTLVDNLETALEQHLLVCQDTGTPVYFVKLGTGLAVDGAKVARAIRRATERATKEHPFRSSIVDILDRTNPQTNTGRHIPVLHWDFIEDADHIELIMVPKGSGSENMSYMKMLVPADGVQGIKRFVLDCVVNSGGNPCPPVIVGVGLGGTAELCMHLAKDAIARPVGSRNPDPRIAALEEELREAINQTGIGPMGLGGLATALAVHIEHAHTHITQNPVGVNIQCWAARRARARIFGDGRVEVGF